MAITLGEGGLGLRLAPESGGHWLALTYHNRDVIVPVGSGEKFSSYAFAAGCYVMAPWCNRVRGAAFNHAGQTHRLTPNFFDGTAIHGDVWARPLQIVQQDPNRVVLAAESRDWPSFNFPYPLAFRYVLELQDNALTAGFFITNRHSATAPVGFGFHPFFPPGAEMFLAAEKIYPIKVGIPQGPPQPVPERRDLRAGRALTAEEWDDQYTGLSNPLLRARYPGFEITLTVDDIFKHCFVYAPPDKPDAPRPFVAVEPMTIISDGLNLVNQGWKDTGLKILEPGETWGGSIQLKITLLPGK